MNSLHFDITLMHDSNQTTTSNAIVDNVNLNATKNLVINDDQNAALMKQSHEIHST